MDDCVVRANASDDVGIARRFIPVLFEIDLAEAVRTLDGLDLSEIGTRRRLAAALEEHESAIRSIGLTSETAALGCETLSGWVASVFVR